jgi:hypothetical protein
MQEVPLDGHLGRSVTIDLCHPCQSFWFDARESLSLTPGSTLSLFRIIGEQLNTPEHPRHELARCPRCQGRLRSTSDMQRTTRFAYLNCPNGHGRLITFFNFLREKDFIRPLTPRQIDALRGSLDTVNCANCGAPVSVAAGAVCAHCRSPLSMLDLRQAEALVAHLQNAEDRTKQLVDPALPLELQRARRDAERAFAELAHDDVWWRDASSTSLVGAGLTAVARWFTRNS